MQKNFDTKDDGTLEISLVKWSKSRVREVVFVFLEKHLSNDSRVPSLFKSNMLSYNTCKLLVMRGDFYVK